MSHTPAGLGVKSHWRMSLSMLLDYGRIPKQECVPYIVFEGASMNRKNCWEAKQCGREPGGVHVQDMGICPAAEFTPADGFLNGTNGGRACCYVAGTFCGGKVQGTYAQKEKTCFACDFYQGLLKDHGTELSAIRFFKYCSVRNSPPAEQKKQMI